jgi:hypothetical protein
MNTTTDHPQTSTAKLLKERSMRGSALAAEICNALPHYSEYRPRRQHVHNWKLGISLPHHKLCAELIANPAAPEWLKAWANAVLQEWQTRFSALLTVGAVNNTYVNDNARDDLSQDER